MMMKLILTLAAAATVVLGAPSLESQVPIENLNLLVEIPVHGPDAIEMKMEVCCSRN